MKKDTRFSIRKLTVGVASIAVASFLTSGSVDAADLSILHSKNEKAAGYNPELPFEPFPPSISYTQPEAPWMQGSVDTEVPGHDVEEVTEPSEANYENPEAPFAPVEEVTEPLPSNGVNPEAPFAPVEEVTEPLPSNGVNPEAPFAPVEEEEEEVTEPRKPNYKDPEAPFAPVEDEDDEEDLEFEILPGYKVEEAIGADGKKYKRLVPIEEEVEEETPEKDDNFKVIEPGYKKTLVDVKYPAPTEEASENVATTRSEIENDLKDVSSTYAIGLKMIIDSPRSGKGTEDFYRPYYEAAKNDQGQTILADYLDYYRKAKDDDTITLEQLVLDSVGKKGGIYETLTVAAAKKLGFEGLEQGQDAYYYKNMMGYNQDLYKNIKKKWNTDKENYGAYAPRKEAQEAVNKVYADMTDLLNAGTAAYRNVTGNEEATPNDALAAGLDYYRKVANKPEATLQDVVEELAQFGFNTKGALELAKQYAKDATSLSDVVKHYKETMGEKVYKYIQDETGKILEGIGEEN